jgi:hypothetical protein
VIGHPIVRLIWREGKEVLLLKKFCEIIAREMAKKSAKNKVGNGGRVNGVFSNLRADC